MSNEPHLHVSTTNTPKPLRTALLMLAVSVLSAVTFTFGTSTTAQATPTSGGFLSADPLGRYIVVLGARMNPNGTPPAILSQRLDRAASLSRSHPINRIIVTGGNSWWLPVSEATFMHLQLFQRGVAPWQVIDEHTAMSTVDNADRVVAMLSGLRASGAVIVTNDFHMSRALKNFREAAEDQHANLTFAPAAA